MQVSRVEVVPIIPKDGLVGFAMIEIDGQFVLHSIGIHKRRDGTGYRLTYPTRQVGVNKVLTLFHPTTPQLSRSIETSVFAKVQGFFAS